MVPAIPQTQLAQDIWDNRSRFPNCILLTRVGQFYEVRCPWLFYFNSFNSQFFKSYFDQAPEVSRRLSIKLTTRAWGGKRVPMCGFPLTHLDRHIKSLVHQQNQFVAMCEEFKVSEGVFERRVARVITPGTLIDESFLNHYENNYLASIASDPSNPNNIGIAWTDVSTGEFFTQETDIESLQDDLARIGPREIVLDTPLKEQPGHRIRLAIMEEENITTSYFSPGSTTTRPSGSDVFYTTATSSDGVFTTSEAAAIHLLTSFLKAHMLECMPKLSSLERQNQAQRMQIDSHTIKALEIKEGMREGDAQSSLLNVVKRTVTSSGTRLLSRWLCTFYCAQFFGLF